MLANRTTQFFVALLRCSRKTHLHASLRPLGWFAGSQGRAAPWLPTKSHLVFLAGTADGAEFDAAADAGTVALAAAAIEVVPAALGIAQTLRAVGVGYAGAGHVFAGVVATADGVLTTISIGIAAALRKWRAVPHFGAWCLAVHATRAEAHSLADLLHVAILLGPALAKGGHGLAGSNYKWIAFLNEAEHRLAHEELRAVAIGHAAHVSASRQACAGHIPSVPIAVPVARAGAGPIAILIISAIAILPAHASRLLGQTDIALGQIDTLASISAI